MDRLRVEGELSGHLCDDTLLALAVEVVTPESRAAIGWHGRIPGASIGAEIGGVNLPEALSDAEVGAVGDAL